MRFATGYTIQNIAVEDMMSVGQLKEAIGKLASISNLRSITLVYQKKILSEGETIQSAEIQDMDYIHAILDAS